MNILVYNFFLERDLSESYRDISIYLAVSEHDISRILSRNRIALAIFRSADLNDFIVSLTDSYPDTHFLVIDNTGSTPIASDRLGILSEKQVMKQIMDLIDK